MALNLMQRLCGNGRAGGNPSLTKVEQCRHERQPGDEESVLVLGQDDDIADAQQVESVARHFGLQAELVCSPEEASASVRRLQHSLVCVVIVDKSDVLRWWPLFQELADSKDVFKIVCSGPGVAEDLKGRLACFDVGANMVTGQLSDVKVALSKVAKSLQDYGTLTCPVCNLSSLSENSLHLHMHLYHAVHPNPPRGPCPICHKVKSNLAVHIHNEHGPPEAREPEFAAYPAFAWCVCRRADGKFLLVNEPAGISDGRPGYWLPAGRVDVGETLVEAAVREAMEEAGVMVRPVGVLCFQIDADEVFRVIFLCEPVNEKIAHPKNVPDWESVGAVWTDVESLKQLTRSDYRSPDPAALYPKVANGELQAHSLDKPSFKKLEKIMPHLTKGDITYLDDIPAIIKELRRDYPASAVMQRRH